jgi:hypothetical protein
MLCCQSFLCGPPWLLLQRFLLLDAGSMLNVLGMTFMLAGATGRHGGSSHFEEHIWMPPFVVLISPALQGENPPYCIKCWEMRKREQLDGTVPPTADSLHRVHRDEKMRRMGVVLDSNRTN